MGNLKGNLQSIGLTDVVQLLHVNKKTGVLKVTNGRDRGVLYVLEGEVVHAEMGQLLGEAAAFEALEWERGDFEFVPVKVRPGESIRRSVPDLLMESARTSDSRKRLRSYFPSLDVVPWPTLPEPALTAGLKLFTEDRKVIPFFDGYRDFRQVIQATEKSEVTVLQAALMLKEAGRLEVLKPTVSLRVVPLRTGLFRALFKADQMIRRGLSEGHRENFSRGDHLELARIHEERWKRMGPYAVNPPVNLRITLPSGPAVEAVQFVNELGEDQIGISKNLMQVWGLSESDSVSVCPAP
jgi:hypothetical protein